MIPGKSERRRLIKDRVAAMKRRRRQRLASAMAPDSAEAKRIQEGRFEDGGVRSPFDPGGVLLDLRLEEIEGIG